MLALLCVTVRSNERERPQQNAIDYAEYGCVRSNAERQRADGDGCEAGIAAQLSQRVPEISRQRLKDYDAAPVAIPPFGGDRSAV